MFYYYLFISCAVEYVSFLSLSLSYIPAFSLLNFTLFLLNTLALQISYSSLGRGGTFHVVDNTEIDNRKCLTLKCIDTLHAFGFGSRLIIKWN